MNEVTNEGKQKIEAWQEAIQSYIIASNALNKATDLLHKREQELGQWLTPNDVISGENFCVWYGDGLIRSTYTADKTYRISVRSRGTKTQLKEVK